MGKYSLKRISVVAVLAVALALPSALMAQGIKDRMKERLPVIVDLKLQGIIGENYYGFLEFLRPSDDHKAVIEGENRDRKAIYNHIAQKEGVPAEQVGIRRARQIADNAKPGEYLETKDGQWYQKKK